MADAELEQQAALIPAQRSRGSASDQRSRGSASDQAGADESDDILDSDLPERPIPAQRSALSERDQQILSFERQWWRHAGAKEQAIKETFQLSATRYYQVLNKLLDDPHALEFDAVLVNRLRRLRMSRARSRA